MDKNNHDSLSDSLREATAGLYYMSETDAPFDVIEPMSVEGEIAVALSERFALEPDAKTEYQNFATLFDRLCAKKDWHDARQLATVEKFATLRRILEENLSDLKVVRIGFIRITVFVVGKDPLGRITGVKTFSVDT